MSNPYSIYEFQYVTHEESAIGIGLQHGEVVDIMAINEPRAWDEFKSWATAKEENVKEVELIGSYQE